MFEWTLMKRLIWIKAAVISGAASLYETISGAIVSFVALHAKALKKLVVNIEPVQDLHGYDAPWPPGGNVQKWDEQWEIGLIDPSNGQNTPSNNYCRSINYIPIDANTSYWVDFAYGTTLYLRFYDAEKNYLSYSQFNSSRTFVPADLSPAFANAAFLRFCWNGQTYENNISFNYPSTVHTYYPFANECPISGWTGADVWHETTYDPTADPSLQISWQDEAGTVYGGTVTVKEDGTAEGADGPGRSKLRDLSWTAGNRNTADTGRIFYCRLVNIIDDTGDLMAEALDAVPYVGPSWESLAVNTITHVNGGYVIACADYADKAAFLAAVGDTYIVYDLITPQTFELSDQPVISTQVGTNNIWADAGDVEVTYYAK